MPEGTVLLTGGTFGPLPNKLVCAGLFGCGERLSRPRSHGAFSCDKGSCDKRGAEMTKASGDPKPGDVTQPGLCQSESAQIQHAFRGNAPIGEGHADFEGNSDGLLAL